MDYIELSKEISYALHHAPWEYELELDENGWISIEQLVLSFREKECWKQLQRSDIVKMIEQSEKKRHEIKDGKIRAYYGHSIPMKIIKEKGVPPSVLYHGTTHTAKNNILASGLKPCSRQYVHLSQDIETAMQVGNRREKQPTLLIIDADQAYKDGINFYLGNEKVWLADFIPAEYIKEGLCFQR